MAAKKATAPTKSIDAADEIAAYANRQTAEYAAICQALREELETVLSTASSKVWHGSPVWFIGENPVAGYNVTSKKGVNLLFWNGQSFGEPALKPAGKFQAAQIQFTAVSKINPKDLRRWLKRASNDVWDSRGYFLAQKALQKQSKLNKG